MIDVIVGFVPFDLKIATAHVNLHIPVRAACEHARHADGTSTGATGQRLARAALPGPLPQLASAKDLDETRR